MTATPGRHTDPRPESSSRRRRPRAPRPVGTFLAAGGAPADAAALADDLTALIELGLIRRVRMDGEIGFQLTELEESTPAEQT